MITDQQGNNLPGATIQAAAQFNEALASFNIYRGDPVSAIDAAIEMAPDFTMAHILKAYLLGLATEPSLSEQAGSIVHQLKSMHLDDREISHLDALESLLNGQWTIAAQTLDMHNCRYPLDMVALQSGHLMDFYRGNARNLRDRIARTLPLWSPDVPGYSIVLGMYAFGLEETGDYAKAEDKGRQAIELQPLDCWAHHAMAHVFEMQGRTQEGMDWMISRQPSWAQDDNFFRRHNWWHHALYLLEAGQGNEALAIYDTQVRKDQSTMALDLIDASALLWRLHLNGIDPGGRWSALANDWEPHADGRSYPFNDWHALMTYLGAQRDDDVESLLACFQNADGKTEVSEWARRTALPLAQGFTAFWRQDYATAVQKLHGARFIANSFGGSHAQRDIIDLTLLEAANRGGLPELARALANERLALKPNLARH